MQGSIAMESILPHERRSFTLEPTYKPEGSNDPYPRSFQQTFELPVASPLPSNFALWPPTPRTAGGRPVTIHESTFSTYPLSSFTSTSGMPVTSSAWEPLDSNIVMSSSLTVPSHYQTAGNDDWDKPRGGFTSLLSNVDEDASRLGNSMGGNGGYLDANYQPVNRNMDEEDTRGRSLSRGSSSESHDSSYQLHHTNSDLSSYEESNYDNMSMGGDYTRRTTPMSMATGTPLSPVMSPSVSSSRMPSVRPQSRKASPSPRPRSRIAPYNTNDNNRNKRWSTGSYFSGHNFTAPFIPSMDNFHSAAITSHHSSPVCGPQPHSHPHTFPPQNYLYSNAPAFNGHTDGAYIPSSFMEPMHNPHGYNHGIMRMLSSNGDPHHYHSDLSEPPDLYASLREEQSQPPPEDMNPEDPEAKPHEQPVRFEGDMYTPRWVRYQGNRREGWCGICKPGRWLVLKNSAFWYDKSFTHGISAATGQRFMEPAEVRRMDGNPDVWEGLCHGCQDWVPLVSNKKKGTAWFRHAYKCHAHPKAKDAAPKKRRDGSQTRQPSSTASSDSREGSVAQPEMNPLPSINRGYSDGYGNTQNEEVKTGLTGGGGGDYYSRGSLTMGHY